MLFAIIHAGRSQSFSPIPKNGCLSTDAVPYSQMNVRYQYDPDSNTKILVKMFTRDLLATSSTNRDIETDRPIRSCHRLLIAPSTPFHDRSIPWTKTPINGPAEIAMNDSMPTIPVFTER